MSTSIAYHNSNPVHPVNRFLIKLTLHISCTVRFANHILKNNKLSIKNPCLLKNETAELKDYEHLDEAAKPDIAKTSQNNQVTLEKLLAYLKEHASFKGTGVLCNAKTLDS